jgi:hypothetical protein
MPQNCAEQPPPPQPPDLPPGCFYVPIPISDGCGNFVECGSAGCGVCNPMPGCCGVTTDPPGAYYVNDCGGTTCVPQSCKEQGVTCGCVDDGCGIQLDCGACGDAGAACPPCVAKNCAEQGFDCGSQGDGCGGTLDCGTCDPCVWCDQGVCAGKFVAPCVPQTCADLGVACGQALDGCCTMLDCGACPTGLTCAQGVCLPVCM